MSCMNPCEYVAPDPSSTIFATSRTHTMLPSLWIIRYCRSKGSPVALCRLFSASACSRSSGCSTRTQKSSSAMNSSAV